MVFCQRSPNHIIYHYTQTKTAELGVKIIPSTDNRKQDVAQRAVVSTEARLMSVSPGVPACPTAWSLVLASGPSRLRTYSSTLLLLLGHHGSDACSLRSLPKSMNILNQIAVVVITPAGPIDAVAYSVYPVVSCKCTSLFEKRLKSKMGSVGVYARPAKHPQPRYR